MTFAGWYGGYGQTVKIQWDYNGNTIELQYSHLDSYNTGSQINKGDNIGVMGNTGYTTGKCLHLEMRINGIIVDPGDYIRP